MTTSNQPLMETPKLRQSVNARIEQARTDHTSMPDLSPQGHSKFCADEAVHHYKDNRPPPLLFEDPDVGFRPISIRKSETYVQVDTGNFHGVTIPLLQPDHTFLPDSPTLDDSDLRFSPYVSKAIDYQHPGSYSSDLEGLHNNIISLSVEVRNLIYREECREEGFFCSSAYYSVETRTEQQWQELAIKILLTKLAAFPYTYNSLWKIG